MMIAGVPDLKVIMPATYSMRSHQITLKENHKSGGGMLLSNTCHLNNIYTSPPYITTCTLTNK